MESEIVKFAFDKERPPGTHEDQVVKDPYAQLRPMLFQTIYNGADFPHEAEKSIGPSLTVPDMSMSLSKLMERSTRGLDVFGNKNPKYDDDDSDEYELDFITPDFKNMDLADREQLAAEAKAEVDRLRVILNKKAKEQQEADRIKADEKALADHEHMQELIKKREEASRKFIKPRLDDQNTNNP